MSKVYVGSLSVDTIDAILRETFKPYGHIVDITIMKDRETGRSSGYAYVTFSSHSEAEAAVSGLHDHDIDNRRVKLTIFNENRRTGGGGGGGGGYQGGGYQGGGGGYQNGGYQSGGGGYAKAHYN